MKFLIVSNEDLENLIFAVEEQVHIFGLLPKEKDAWKALLENLRSVYFNK